MVVAVLILLATLAFAKENFRVSPDNASSAEACLNHGLCHPTNGCCSGHGYCDATNTSAPFCVCTDKPLGCHSSYTSTYSGATCSDSVIGNSTHAGCCVGPTYNVKRHISGACNQRTHFLGDPEEGAYGRLLRRVGPARYSDNISTYSIDDVATIVDYLTDEERPDIDSPFTMMGVAILELATYDIVRFALRDDAFHNISGKSYAKLKGQQRTGETWGSTLVPTQHENDATGELDLDMLYRFSPRKNTTNTTIGSYIDYAQAISHFSDLHFPETTLVLLEWYGMNHNFLVKAHEMTIWIRASDESDFDHVTGCSVPAYATKFNTNQKIYDNMYDFARAANIRGFQLAVSNAAFQLIQPFDQPSFEYFLHPEVSRKWSCEAYLQDFRDGDVETDPAWSAGSEFTTRVALNEPMSHTWISPLLLTSMKVYIDFGPQFISTPICDQFNVTTTNQKLLYLMQTPAKGFGSRIDPYFADDATYLLIQMAEAGVGYYNAFMSATGVNNARSPDTNLFVGLMDDVQSGSSDYNTNRLWQSDPTANSRVLFAIFGQINDVLNIDSFGSWLLDGDGYPTNYWIEIMADQGLNVYVCEGTDSICYSNQTKFNAWQILTGSRNDNTMRDDLFRSRGIVNAYPCSFPGLAGALIAAGVVHYHYSAPLIFDWVDGTSLPTYATLNDLPVGLRFDETYLSGQNGINGCLPWRISLFDSRVDSPCCEAAREGGCGCYTSPWGDALCGVQGMCDSYLDFSQGPIQALFENYSQITYADPALHKGFAFL